MTTSPTWSATDADTASLLDLLADDGSAIPGPRDEWETFKSALLQARGFDNVIAPNALRPMVRGLVKPCRIGAFTRRACLEGLIEPTGGWQISDDTEGGNAGRPMREYRWLGAR